MFFLFCLCGILQDSTVKLLALPVTKNIISYWFVCHTCSGPMVWQCGKYSVEETHPIMEWTPMHSKSSWSLGEGWTNQQMLLVLVKCKLPSVAHHCYDNIIYITMVFCHWHSYAMMVKCWNLNPQDRPTFKELDSNMSNLKTGSHQDMNFRPWRGIYHLIWKT